jgi:hypothetical protein
MLPPRYFRLYSATSFTGLQQRVFFSCLSIDTKMDSTVIRKTWFANNDANALLEPRHRRYASSS